MNRETQRTVRFDFYPVNRIGEMERLKRYDNWIAQDIAAAEAAIEEAKAYRLELAKRAAQLEIMQSHTRVTLKRERRDSVTYYLYTEKVYEDGTAQMLQNNRYEGKDRHKAIKAFRDMRKAYPGYEYVENIQRGYWEC
jgi:hypothetical protein